MLIFSLFFVFLLEISNAKTKIETEVNCGDIAKCAHLLGELFTTDFGRITKVDEIRQSYDKLVKEENYDPRTELRDSKARIEKYVNVREEFLKSAKQSLENKTYYPVKDETDFEEINDIRSPKFIRYMSAKQGNDATIVYKSNHLGESEIINETSHFTHTPNANFYLLNTSYDWSAVHVPTPIYDRNPEILRKIDWSNIDQLYQKNRDSTKDLAFQLFCSESGFMRYYPAAPWYWSNEKDNLDLFDCRNTEWYINSATNSKNVMIMLDLSGSMLGQRFEVAKQATEAILGTLSHNDYFNIMSFTKSPNLLDDCNGTRGLLQATMKNKKALRMRMNDIASEGKADYDLALTLAFDKLLNLKGEHHLYSKEEFAMMGQNITEGLKPFELNEHILLASEEYLKSVSTGGEQNGAACENIIMLITDGSPTNNKKLLDTLNPNKDVRVFTFLIGEEAIDFNEVREMACDNRGYMVHVANMADVDEKIQYYIKRMSRVVGTESQDKQLKWWTGVYREKLYLPRAAVYSKPEPMPSRKHAVMRKEAAKRKIRIIAAEARNRMFVTTVSYPVIYNKTFMGVAAVTIPLTEIAQKAHPSHIGAKSYFFMLDQNGFIMVHPQLRPIDQSTKSQKINYNSMDLLEVEIAQSREFRNSQKIKASNKCHDDYEQCSEKARKEVRRNMIECNNQESPHELEILYATDNLDRVYPQVNSYYAECINNTDFVIGLAVAKDETVRITRKTENYDFSKVRLSWVKNETSDLTFRIHPYWRYCFLNDSDTDISKEQAFVVYLEQMVATKRVPYLCTKRQYLVERLLIDLEATENLIPAWEEEENVEIARENLIHLTFFAASSGMIRTTNWTLEPNGYAYEEQRTIFDNFKKTELDWVEIEKFAYRLTIDQVPESYNHFITQNSKSSDDPYYKRAVRMKDTLMFEVNNKTKLWYLSETELTTYELNENFTIVGQAYKAVYKDKAVLGVAGFEFAYEYVVSKMIEHGCKTLDPKKWCVLLDEHAYVFFTSELQSYEGYFRGEGHVGKFFGSINRISQRAMELLVDAKYYNKLVFTDHQTSCEHKSPNGSTQSANRSINPIYSLIRFLVHTFNYLVKLASTISGGYLIWIPNIPITTAYTASFHEGMNKYPCSKHSNFYFTNKDGVVKPSRILEENTRDRPCKTKQCGVKIEASYVTGTNLLMVWIIADEEKEKCYSETECAMNENSPIKFGFVSPDENKEEKTEKETEKEAAEEMMKRCQNIEFRKSKANDVCYPIDEDKTEKVTPQLCSLSTSTPTLIIFIILFVKNVLII